ncbi:MAG: hypothetical protein D6706_19405, partial [Chloroflexi bacterium]
MDITLKILGKHGNITKTLSGLSNKSTLKDARDAAIQIQAIPPNTHFFFATYGDGTEVAVQDEKLVAVFLAANTQTTPWTLYMTQNPDIVGTKVEWISQGGLDFQVKLERNAGNSAEINKDKVEPFQLINVSKNSVNLPNIQNAVICDAGSAVRFNYAYAGPAGYHIYTYTGADPFIHKFGICSHQPNKRLWCGSGIYDGSSDLIKVDNAHAKEINASGQEILRHWMLTVEVFGLTGWQTGDKDDNNKVWGGDMAGGHGGGGGIMVPEMLQGGGGGAGNTITIRGRDVDPGYITHGPHTDVTASRNLY